MVLYSNCIYIESTAPSDGDLKIGLLVVGHFDIENSRLILGSYCLSPHRMARKLKTNNY